MKARTAANTVALAALAAGIILGGTGCASSQPVAPLNHLTCSKYPAGKMTAYAPAQAPPGGYMKATGTWQITGGEGCSWTFLSETGPGGQVYGWVDPPATFTLTSGKKISIPGGDQVFVDYPPGSTKENP